MSNPFEGIENAKTSFESNWVREGRYHAEIGAVKLTKKEHTKEEFLAIEMTVTKVLDDNGGTGHKVGESITQLMKVSNPSFLGNVKQFISAVTGCDPAVIDQVQADRVTSEEQPMAGRVVEFNARNIKTRKGDDFTKVTYISEVTE